MTATILKNTHYKLGRHITQTACKRKPGDTVKRGARIHAIINLTISYVMWVVVLSESLELVGRQCPSVPFNPDGDEARRIVGERAQNKTSINTK